MSGKTKGMLIAPFRIRAVPGTQQVHSPDNTRRSFVTMGIAGDACVGLIRILRLRL